MTQPLLLEQLREFGIEISSGKISQILIDHKDDFHREKDAIIKAGLEVSAYVSVDDTGARHKGKNGYCTHIGNDLFSWFESTPSKSRINFLKLLRAGGTDYVINEHALDHWQQQKLPLAPYRNLAADLGKTFDDDDRWSSYLRQLGIDSPHHIRIATEGALLGSVIEHGVSDKLVILSDDAGQFAVLIHALCWVHAERNIAKIIPMSSQGKEDQESIRNRIWQLYQDLKAYKDDPTPDEAKRLEQVFDDIFTTQTSSVSLNKALERIHRNRTALLLVLERPEVPLHNNGSETAVRDYVKKRKISGGTRSEAGRSCRDTFATLKKTCRKLKIPFWQYLGDRLRATGMIANLASIIRERASQSA